MAEYILMGCDLHDENMVLRIAADKGPVEKQVFPNTRSGHEAMLADLKRRSAAAGGAKVIVVYEAGPHGFVLHDAVKEAGMGCHVLAPTNLPQSPKSRRRKSDGRDSRRLLRHLRSHLFADEDLDDIWVPEPTLRDERELVRLRADSSREVTRTKNRIQMLLKRYGLRRPKHVGAPWTKRHCRRLQSMTGDSSPLAFHTRLTLGYQLDHLTWLEGRLAAMDEDVLDLARTPRYAEPVREAIRACEAAWCGHGRSIRR